MFYEYQAKLYYTQVLRFRQIPNYMKNKRIKMISLGGVQFTTVVEIFEKFFLIIAKNVFKCLKYSNGVVISPSKRQKMILVK